MEKDSFEDVRSEISDQTTPINAAKFRLAELEREEKELTRRAEIEVEKSKQVLAPPAIIIAVDILIAGSVLSRMFYQLWIRELPDGFHSLTMLVGLIFIAMDLQKTIRNHSQKKLVKQIEKRLKTIAKIKAETTGLIDSSI